MLTADFWLKKTIETGKIIAGPEEIDFFNKEILRKSSKFVYDLAQYPVKISKETLSKLLDSQSFMAQNRYLGNELLGDEYYQKLQQEINSQSIREGVAIKYAFTVKRTHLRILPTNDFVTNRPNDAEFDRLQETAITAAEPLLILHKSSSNKWYFVQSYYAAGWILAEDIAVTSNRTEWLSYMTTKKFLVVTGNRIRLGVNPYSPEISELEFYMGDKLPLVDEKVAPYIDRQSVVGNYIIKLPVRQDNGELAFKLALLPINSAVSLGYLPYTRENILRQAFKMQGDRYGWGGSFKSRDCSSFIMDIYRSFGFKLPRNTWEQMNTAGLTIEFTDKTEAERKQLLNTVLPGTALYFKGHVMLYLGESEGEYYILHAIAECGDSSQEKIGDTLPTIPLYNIMVTPLSLLRTTGQSLLGTLTVGKSFQ